MLNSAQDNNVLTKCDKESNFPINFQPTPKRFIAWDKHKKDWVTKFLMPSTSDEDSDDYTCPLTLGVDTKGEKNWLNNDQLIVCQSTNLFDKDGEEIFEGSIVMYNHNTYFVRQDRYNGMWLLKNVKTGDCSESINGWENGKDERLKLLGHILSSPELLRRNNHDDN